MRRITRGILVLVAILLLLAALGLGAMVAVGSHHSVLRGPVYTVDQFLTRGYAFRLLRGQSAWVRGTAADSNLYPNILLIEGPARGSPGGIGLMVYRGSENPLWARLRKMPLLASFVPPTAAHPLTGRTATYRVEFVGCPNAPACSNGMTEWRLESSGE